MAEDQIYPLPATAVIIPLLAACSIILNIPPLISHIRNRNIPAASLVLWFIEVNFINFLNAVIWPTDDVAHWFSGKILCDIEIKLMPAAYIGVVGALIGIMKKLAQILDTKNTVLEQTRAQKRRQMWLDIFLCWGLPCVFMVLHYVVQSARFVIYTVSGCSTPYHLSWMTVVLIYMWPPILSIVVFYYCILVLHRMRKYRRDFSSILSSSNSSLSRNRFMRLFLMSIILIFILFPAQTYVLYDFVRQVSYPYRWSVVHGPDWGDIILIPTNGMVTPDHWIQIAVGFLIFAFFGLGHDAQEMYRKWLLQLGLGRVFPNLRLSTRERRRLKASQDSGTSSVGSGARLLKGKLVRSSWTARFKKGMSRSSRSVTSSVALIDTKSDGRGSPSSAQTRFSNSPTPFQPNSLAQQLMEPLPAVHQSPSRFHNFFRQAHNGASDRRMAAGLMMMGGPSTLVNANPTGTIHGRAEV